MKALAVVVGIAVVGALLWSGCRESQSRAEWARDTTRVFQGVQAREDSAHRMLQEAESLKTLAESLTLTADRRIRRGETAYSSAMNYRDSLDALLTASPDTSQALALAITALDSLQVGYDSLASAFVGLRGSWAAVVRANKSLLQAYQLQRESVDSLVQLVRRAPEECRFLTIPCPRIYLGVGVVQSEGALRVGPSVGFGIRIPF